MIDHDPLRNWYWQSTFGFYHLTLALIVTAVIWALVRRRPRTITDEFHERWRMC